MITLKGIAEECGVSTATVSNILNGKKNVSEKTRQQVMAVIERENYSPNSIARGLRSQRTGQIGIIVEDLSQFNGPPIVEGIMSYFEYKGYRSLVRNMRMYARWSDTWYDNGAGFHAVLDPILREMKAGMVDGIVYVAGHARNIKCIPDNLGIPVVMTYGYSDDPGVKSVVIDDESASYELVKYLVSQGHKKIAILAGTEDNLHTQARMAGIRRALNESSIPYDENLVHITGWLKDDGYKAGNFLVNSGATVALCMSDRVAGGIYQYLNEQGIEIGKDISVVGFDNQIMADYMIPGLTTVDIPLHWIGSTSADLLDKMINGEEVPGEIHKIKLNTIKRESVRKIN